LLESVMSLLLVVRFRRGRSAALLPPLAGLPCAVVSPIAQLPSPEEMTP